MGKLISELTQGSIFSDSDKLAIEQTNQTVQMTLGQLKDNIIDYSALPGQSGGLSTVGDQGSYTLSGGLIIKYGTLNSPSEDPVVYTFTTAFPTAMIGINATANGDAEYPGSFIIDNLSKTGFILTEDLGLYVGLGRVFWMAYGF
jgi:hypothetical protein